MFKYPHGDLHGLNLDWLLEAWKTFQDGFTHAFNAVITQIGVNDPPTVTVTYDDNSNNYEFDFGMPAPVKPSGFLIGYQSSSSGTTIPTGTWLANPPVVPQGDFLWTKTQVNYNDGQYSATYSCSRQGIDGTGTGALYFTGVTISAVNGTIATVNNADITADHVIAEIEWGSPGNLKSDITWTTASGSLTLTGNCKTATTANIVLIKKIN